MTREEKIRSICQALAEQISPMVSPHMVIAIRFNGLLALKTEALPDGVFNVEHTTFGFTMGISPDAIRDLDAAVPDKDRLVIEAFTIEQPRKS